MVDILGYDVSLQGTDDKLVAELNAIFEEYVTAHKDEIEATFKQQHRNLVLYGVTYPEVLYGRS